MCLPWSLRLIGAQYAPAIPQLACGDVGIRANLSPVFQSPTGKQKALAFHKFSFPPLLSPCFCSLATSWWGKENIIAPQDQFSSDSVSSDLLRRKRNSNGFLRHGMVWYAVVQGQLADKQL